MTVRVADFEDDTPTERDAAATWLLGHTERITFGTPYARDGQLLSDAIVRVPCKYLQESPDGGNGDGAARCAAHGFQHRVPAPPVPPPPTFRNGGDRFTIVHDGRIQQLALRAKRKPPRSLPVLETNPCMDAPCRTADNRRGAACCRDLTLDVALARGERRLEALLRSRTSPYLCKIKRTNEDTVECEVISACGYLDDDGVGCVLHDRTRPNNRSAKPGLCYDWPDFEDDDEFTGHPGCVFLED